MEAVKAELSQVSATETILPKALLSFGRQKLSSRRANIHGQSFAVSTRLIESGAKWECVVLTQDV